MTVAAGKLMYELGNTPCSGVGLAWSSDELDAAMNGPVIAVLFDDKGRADIQEILTGLAETDFAQEGLQRILSARDSIDDWRVGETIAEKYLTDHRDCHFPWPDGRDERKSGSSLPGADLVGFRNDEDGDCLAFGEVKTSSQSMHPPSTMHGRTGLARQLEDLRDRVAIRDDLLRYLCHRAKEVPWRQRFENASGRYLNNKFDVQLFGFLVRDVDPHQDDLRVRVSKLAEGCPEGTRIELLALYLPKGRIDRIGESAITKRTGTGV